MQHCREEISCTMPALVSVPHPLQMHNLFHINTVQTVKRTATEHTSSESKNMYPLAKKQAESEQKAKFIHPSSQPFYHSHVSFYQSATQKS